MRISFYGLVLDTPRVTVSLASPWRATALEHKLFDVACKLSGSAPKQHNGEQVVEVRSGDGWDQVFQGIIRILKGWQEEANQGSERRHWRWLMEAEADPYGYDAAGEPCTLWAFLQLAVEFGGPGETDKTEQVEQQCLNFRFWPLDGGKR